MNLFQMAQGVNRVPVGTVEGELKIASHTMLELYLNCPYSALLRVRNAKSGVKPAPNPFAERGINLHDWIEKYIKGDLKILPADVKNHREYIEKAKELYESGIVMQLEMPWFFDREYVPCEKKDRRIMVKQDLFYFTGANSAVLDDWKTGKRDGNEAKHARQIKRYVIAAFMRFPELEYVEGSARYLDKNDIFTRGYTREQAMAFFKTEENLLRRFFHDTKCMPKPNRINCKGCEYNKPNEDGEYQCEYGVRDV